MTLAILMITTYIFLNKGFMCKLVVTLETQTHLFTASGKPFFFCFLLPQALVIALRCPFSIYLHGTTLFSTISSFYFLKTWTMAQYLYYGLSVL